MLPSVIKKNERKIDYPQPVPYPKPVPDLNGKRILNQQLQEVKQQNDKNGFKWSFPNRDNICKINLEITPSAQSYWYGGKYEYEIQVDPVLYPAKSPTAIIKTMIFHPNLDFNGAICLSILGKWQPNYHIYYLFTGLQKQLEDLQNPDDPLNKEAAQMMAENMNTYREKVKQTLRGGCFFGQQFPKLVQN